MPAITNINPIKLHLVSSIARKSFTQFLLKENSVIFLLSIISGLFLSASSIFTPDEEVSEAIIEWNKARPFVGLMIGAILGLIMMFVFISMNDRFYVVGIIVEDDAFKVISRRVKRHTLRTYSGHFEELTLYKDKMKFSPMEAAKVCYRVYCKTEYMGILVPDHFIWEDCAISRINMALKKLKRNISR